MGLDAMAGDIHHEQVAPRADDPAQKQQAGPVSFRELLEAIPDAVVISNQAGKIVLVNSQTERLFGYARQQLTQQPVEMLIPERFRSQHTQHRTHYSEKPYTRPMGSGLELLGRRADGTEFPAEISL